MDFIQLGIGRWLHIISGVMWIGLLYYFNFVQVPALAEAAKDNTGAGITKHVAPRALFWFRWAAVATWLFGAMLLGAGFFKAFFFMDRAFYAIGVGAWLGTIMFFNVWVLIWPNQKKILGMVQATDAEKARARRVAFLASRTNTMLSIPMLFFMAAAGHQGIFFG
ncbi:MAG TPA: urate hydroxylase PuuD [Longimicrobiales bacterium]